MSNFINEAEKLCDELDEFFNNLMKEKIRKKDVAWKDCESQIRLIVANALAAFYFTRIIHMFLNDTPTEDEIADVKNSVINHCNIYFDAIKTKSMKNTLN